MVYSVTSAQIGYQVSLLNSATGEPRANETVSANIVITDAKNSTVYSTTQSATTNDFGVLSFAVGDANTFKDVAIGRLPLYISVTVGGTLIGKSQILSVPVAEIANTLKSDFTMDELCQAWEMGINAKVVFNRDGTWVWTASVNSSPYTKYSGTFEVEGNNIYAFIKDSYNTPLIIFRIKNSKLYVSCVNI